MLVLYYFLNLRVFHKASNVGKNLTSAEQFVYYSSPVEYYPPFKEHIETGADDAGRHSHRKRGSSNNIR